MCQLGCSSQRCKWVDSLCLIDSRAGHELPPPQYFVPRLFKCQDGRSTTSTYKTIRCPLNKKKSCHKSGTKNPTQILGMTSRQSVFSCSINSCQYGITMSQPRKKKSTIFDRSVPIANSNLRYPFCFFNQLHFRIIITSV